MTSRELKSILDLHIDSLAPIIGAGYNGQGNKGFFILLAPGHYTKAKYSCTTEEKDFQFVNGTLTYRGFELSTNKGLSPYRR